MIRRGRIVEHVALSSGRNHSTDEIKGENSYLFIHVHLLEIDIILVHYDHLQFLRFIHR